MKNTMPNLKTSLKMGFARKAEQMRNTSCSVLFFCSTLSIFAAAPVAPIVPWDSPEDNGVLLHSGWQLRDIPSLNCSDMNTAGTTVSKAAFVPSGWMQATVPGTILACMVNNGTFPDPNYGKNMEIIQARFVNTDYVYQTRFQVQASCSGRRIWLNYEGISRNAIVFVNGTKVGMINGVWTRGKFDITSCVNADGKNGLAVIIRKGTSSSDNPDTDKGQGFSGHNLQGNECHPAIPGDGNGIYAEVYLTSTGNIRIVDPFVSSDLPLPATSPAKLTIRTELQNLTATPQSGTVKGTIGAIAFQQEVSLAPNATKTVTFSPETHPGLSIASPRLWWPNGYGDPNLHTLKLAVQMKDASISDSKTLNFGIREVTYDTSGDPSNLKIRVNGVPIFCRGGNWMSPDLFMRFDAVKADIDARFHKEMGFTMIRFWKGQVPFRQAFEANDRYGILTWCEWNGLGGESYTEHNMWGYGGIRNPESIEGLRDMLKRVRKHPSVVIHVGNNEQPSPPDGMALFKAQMNELHPDMLFVDHSASLPIHNYSGPWSVTDPVWYWNYGEKLGLYSEIGLPHVLSIESMRAMMPEADLWPINSTGMWSYHQIDSKNTDGNQYLAKINTQYGPSKNIEQFCAKAAALNYENNRAIMEGAANSMWNRCGGVLLWMSKSAWANLNWSTYDYYYGVDGTYFGNKKACEPLHIQWDIRNWNVSVINATLKTQSGLTAVAEVYNSDAKLKSTRSAPVNAAANSKTAAFTIAKPDGLTPVHFIKLLLKHGNDVISENFYWNGNTYLDYTRLDSLPQANLELSAKAKASGDETVVAATLCNATQSIAFMPRLCLVRATSGKRVLPTFYSDNYRSLLPGERCTITMRCKTADLKGESPKLNLDGYNITMKSLALSVASATRTPANAGPGIDPERSSSHHATTTSTTADIDPDSPETGGHAPASQVPGAGRRDGGQLGRVGPLARQPGCLRSGERPSPVPLAAR